MRVAIVGCGYVGGALAKRLWAEGHEVVAIRRSRRPGYVSANARDIRSLRAAAGGRRFDGLVYAVSPNERSDEGYRGAYVEGFGNALAAIRARRTVLVSSSGVAAAGGGRWVDERWPLRIDSSTSFVVRRLIEAERIARRHGACVLRLTGIYGPGRERLIRMVRDGSARIPEDVVFTNRIHRDDAAAIVDHLLRLDRVQPVYFGTDREAASYAEVVRFLAKRLGVPEPPMGTVQRRSNKRVSCAQLLRSGFRHRYPTFREGYGALLQEYRSVD